MFQFSCRFAFFINFSSLKPDTEDNANFDTVTAATLMPFSKEDKVLIKKICINVKVTTLGSL